MFRETFNNFEINERREPKESVANDYRPGTVFVFRTKNVELTRIDVSIQRPMRQRATDRSDWCSDITRGPLIITVV